MREPSDQKENPDSLAGEIGVEGIEALPKRVERYGKAKKGALDTAEYMQGLPGQHGKEVAQRVMACGDYLLFRHFFTVDTVRLHGAQFCKAHLLCPLCAIRRGAKALSAYLARWECIKAERPALRAFLVTLTVKDGDDLAERFRHLHAAQRELWKRKQRGRGSCLDGVVGAVWSYEVKRGSGSGSWHPHLHMIALAEVQPDAHQLAQEWHQITGDSFRVDVRPISPEDPVSGFIEVFKYAVKFSDQEPADTVHAWQTLRGKRLLASSGVFRAVDVSDELTDDCSDLEGLPFMDMLYAFSGAGYSLKSQSPIRQNAVGFPGYSQKRTHAKGKAPDPRKPSYTRADFLARYRRMQLEKMGTGRPL
jgi:plasmid rolling circle replication initiator protein Rep